MKKFWFEIILIIVGIIILSYSTDHSPNNSMMLKGIGISTFLLAFVWFIIHVTIINKKKEQTHSKDFPVKQGNIRHYDMIINDQHNLENDSFNHSTKNSDLKLDEKRIQFLREKITILNNFVQKQIISSEDIYSLSNSQLRPQDVDYIAEQLICPLFDLNTTVKRIENNIKTMNFSDDEFIRLMMYGSSSLQKHLFDTCEQTNWIMSSYVFYKISQFNPLLLFHFIYSEDTIHKAFNAMNAAELLGFRIKSKTKEQETPWSTIPTLDGTECPYYEDVDTDIIYVIEQNFPNNDTLRKQIFDKIFNSPYVLTASIERWDNVTEYEFTKILDRHNEEEIEALFDRDDISTIIDQFSEDIAIKVYLGLVYPNAVQTVKDSYTFKDVKTFKTIINELSAEELLGKDDYDIIKLIENEMGDDEELRALAFAKLCQLPDMSSRISEWDNVTENETKLIMERNNDEEINALFGRDDSNDVICNLPEDIAIKVYLGLLYPDAFQTVKDYYSFTDKEIFKKVINELSAEELLGEDDYDIIKLIENEMEDDEELRTLAFAKLCQLPDISSRISEWDNVTEEEIKVIMERKNDEEISALFDRSDSDDVIGNLPEDIAIKIYLGVLYPDAFQTVKDYYSFTDEEAFKTVISNLSPEELLGEDDYDIIKLIEDEMGDDEELRALAFAKLCQLPDMSSRISEWDNVTENETKLIMERNNDEEINALFGRDDSNDVICNLPDSLVIKFHLLDDEEVIHDEYFNRIDDDEFRGQVEKMTKGLLPKELTDSQKNSDVESLSDEIIIKARLGLFDLDECSFDSEEIADEFNDRINKDEFKKKIENLNFK